ncbi:MAG: phage baseplate assembly protein V [Pseudomonadota bacterium]
MFDFAQIERRLEALEKNRGASLRFGVVTEVNVADGSVRVQLPDGEDMVSLPLRVLQDRTLKDQKQCFPDLGEPVACLFAGQGLEQGVVLGACYSSKTVPQDVEAYLDYTRYSDGTTVYYDREKHALVADVKGSAKMTTTGNIDVVSGASIAATAETQMTFTVGGSTITVTPSVIAIKSGTITLN